MEKILKHIFRKVKFLKLLNSPDLKKNHQPPLSLKIDNSAISKSLEKNYQVIKDIFKNQDDVIIRRFVVGERQIEAFIVNIDGLVEKTSINENIMGSLMWETRKIVANKEITLDDIKKSAININEIKEAKTMEEVVDGILSGNTVFFMEESNIALLIGTQAWEHRGVEKPETEALVRGPREAFTETLRVNTSLVRRKIKDPDLNLEMMKIGRRTRTQVYIVYIKGVANEKIVEEVRKRLQAIDIDAILESGYIEDFINDAPLSVFPTVGNTESADKFAAKILEGRVGILVDGTPFALTVPLLFFESLQAAEDYYSRPFFASQIRVIRFLALHMSLLFPAVYVALSTYHPAVLPTPLLITMAAAREGIPFPAFAEALLMGIMFEGLREAGIRMPRPVGQAVSIVGALVLGEAAVNAGIVSPPMVIVTALTAIMSFLLPPQIDAVTLLRIPILVLAATFGLYGVVWAYLFIIIHLNSLRSFGIPYMSPLMPFSLQDMKDFIVRFPWWMMKTRPRLIGWKDLQREGPGLKSPGKSNSEGDKP